MVFDQCGTLKEGRFNRATDYRSRALGKHRSRIFNSKKVLSRTSRKFAGLPSAMSFVATGKRSVHACSANCFKRRTLMNHLLIPKELRPIAEKVEAPQRVSEPAALSLHPSNVSNL